MENNELKEFDSKDILGEAVDMKSYINELVDALRNDQEVYDSLKPLKLSLGEVRANITKLVDYQEDFHYCKNCKGLDKCYKKTPHTVVKVNKEGNYISISHDPCQKLIDKMKVDSKYIFADFPDEWKKSRIKEMDLSETRRPIISLFRDIVKGRTRTCVYLKGNHKVGKSFLLVTFANEFIGLGMGEVGIINANKKFKELNDLAYNDKTTFEKQMVALSTLPLLIIDDFGSEYKSEYVRDQILYPILSERYKNDLLTFFTSELTIDEIQKLYSFGKNGGDIRGKQLGNILKEMCKEFDVSGASIYKK